MNSFQSEQFWLFISGSAAELWVLNLIRSLSEPVQNQRTTWSEPVQKLSRLYPLTCSNRMNWGKRWMGLTIRPYRVIRSRLDACFFWKDTSKDNSVSDQKLFICWDKVNAIILSSRTSRTSWTTNKNILRQTGSDTELKKQQDQQNHLQKPFPDRLFLLVWHHSSSDRRQQQKPEQTL